MWLTVCGATQSVVRNLADSSETGPGTAAIGRRTWQVKYSPQTDRRWVRSGLADVRLKNILEMDRVRSSYDGGMRTVLLRVTVLRPALWRTFWPLKAELMNLFGVWWWFRCLMMNFKKLHTFLWKPVSATEYFFLNVIAFFLSFIICEYISHNSDFVSRNSEKKNININSQIWVKSLNWKI